MMADLVLGLEVVLPDGQIWTGLRAVQKDNAGYALRRLFCGAEGTLGVVTRATLRLHPAPTRRVTALLALPNPAALVRFGRRLRAATADTLVAAEFFSDTGLALALAHVPGLAFPLDTRAEAYLLVELATAQPRIPLDDILSDLLETGMEAGEVLDGTIAASDAQRAALWRLREDQPEGQRLAGAQAKHDISVPPGQIATFIARGQALCDSTLPGLRINPFGHLCDGNIHYNLTPPPGARDFGAADIAALSLSLAALAQDLGGSFAAEHGLGRSKIALADALRPPVERALMADLKRALDPGGLMNPGVILATDHKA
jgi:FAD/FMN-containing dehydrogenase